MAVLEFIDTLSNFVILNARIIDRSMIKKSRPINLIIKDIKI